MLYEMPNPYKEIRIMLAGGGTAGHINPLFAVYEELIKIKLPPMTHLRFSFIGGPNHITDKFIKSGIPVKKIFSFKISKGEIMNNIIAMPVFIISFFQSIWHILWEMPTVLFSKGGPGAFAPIIAAKIFFIPVVIHDSDAIPSYTTKISSMFAKKIFLAFEEAIPYIRLRDQKKCEVVGNPLRSLLLASSKDKRLAKIALRFNPDKPLMIIIGGSQGSRRINNLITQSITQILKLGVQVFHQTGIKLFGEVSGVLGHYFDSLEEMDSAGYQIIDFFDHNIQDVLSAADIIVSRSGSSIFEFAALGIPSILIPFPEAAQNHQLKNALSYEKSGACIVLEEHEISIKSFIELLEHLIFDIDLLEKMSESAKVFAKPNASHKIAEELIKLSL